MKYSLIVASIVFFSFSLQAQEKKSIHIKRTDNAPKIDAILDDEAWINAEVATNFTQFRPEMGVKPKAHQQTKVKIAYNDNAIFFAAYLYDKPEAIMKQFTQRDDFGISDFFGIVLNPNNDAQNDVEFFVFPTGNQADAIANPTINEDFGWNAVWESATKIVDDGWIVEVKIPYSALRFSNEEIQTWGIQFHRRFRTDNSQYTWNPLDRTKGNIGLYHGELTGIQNIKPPTRLSFYPFASAVINSFDGKTNEDYNLGLDLKYGVSENFTLDATLIPDFSQAGFDNVQLNLGPFEQQYSEQRQFFTEGVDLFSKGNLFYSRRIGSTPIQRNSVSNNLLETDDDFETIIDNPEKVNMLNAVKISGRTKNGLGIGVFNAITEKTQARIRRTKYTRNAANQIIDTTTTYRNQVTEPLANYNIIVLDQQFGGNSSVSFINTNVTRNGHFKDANVTGLLLDFKNKKNTIGLEVETKHSLLNLETGNVSGFSGGIGIGKISGNHQYSMDYSIADKKFDINDFGIQNRNNFSNFGVDYSYRIFEPSKNLLNFNYSLWFNYRMLYKPNTYYGKNIGGSFYGQTHGLMDFGGNFNYEIGKQYDYFEPRAEGRYFIFENWMNTNVWISTNYNKTFALDTNVGFGTMVESGRDVFKYWFGIGPRVRFSDKFNLQYKFDFDQNNGSRGFVNNNGTDIIFGERNIKTIENSLSGSYNFNTFHALSLTVRNYWSTVDYDNDLYALENNGRLSQTDNYTLEDINSPNVNFNTWNFDFGYSWQFAPGSQFTALYRNNLFHATETSKDTYFNSVDQLFDNPINHNFSVRLVYYIDYNNVKNIFKTKSKNI